MYEYHYGYLRTFYGKVVGGMKFILVSPKNRTVYNFRGDLIRQIVEAGNEVIVTGPDQVDVEKIKALGASFEEIPNDESLPF
jgi:hypothetical protein